jgi:hypothetical protein
MNNQIPPLWQTKSPRELGEKDLRLELNRLEAMLKDGTLSTMDGSRLAHVRRVLKRLDELKAGSMEHGIG